MQELWHFIVEAPQLPQTYSEIFDYLHVSSLKAQTLLRGVVEPFGGVDNNST